MFTACEHGQVKVVEEILNWMKQKKNKENDKDQSDSDSSKSNPILRKKDRTRNNNPRKSHTSKNNSNVTNSDIIDIPIQGLVLDDVTKMPINGDTQTNIDGVTKDESTDNVESDKEPTTTTDEEDEEDRRPTTSCLERFLTCSPCRNRHKQQHCEADDLFDDL